MLSCAARLRCGTGAASSSRPRSRPASARLPRTSTKADASPRVKKPEHGSDVHAGASTGCVQYNSTMVLATDSDLAATQTPGSPERLARLRTRLRRRLAGDPSSIPIGSSPRSPPDTDLHRAYPSLPASSPLGPCSMSPQPPRARVLVLPLCIIYSSQSRCPPRGSLLYGAVCLRGARRYHSLHAKCVLPPARNLPPRPPTSSKTAVRWVMT